ncbi:Coq4 family protein [Polyangium sp. 15x6]|uniref:Coq4 family protein n=1 Tax=Polyangium sp. 15x6 TaxID=3042687 RepID=UPI00249AF320|nr:Coq4 family protein [Polyangium sp. 15x6]MDI3283166.1 Coq4 family protein [Polyangium sp. 15x6]
MAKSHTRIELDRALRAARILAADPDDLPQVFTIIEALSGGTLQRIADRMAKSETGRKLLAERKDIVDVLADREALARLPEGSLGRAYLAFVERENISADGIREAAVRGTTGRTPFPEPIEWVHGRMRDTHDLWHAAVGYQGDVLGETALLAFTLAQTYNPAIALIVAIGLVKTLGKPEARSVILDGFRRGRKAAWLPEQDWASMLALPVDEVRRRLSLEAPPHYKRVNSTELRAAAAAA